jgi:hypothetical protein
MTQKEVATTQKNEVSTEVKAWGAAEDIDSAKDLIVPKIMHQQAISAFVKSDEAKAGDWCDSLTGEVLCKKTETIGLIVFSSYKLWRISKLENDKGKEKYVYLKSEPYTAENSNYEYHEETEDGRLHRQLTYNFYCLLADNIDELPYVLTLTSTKTKVAKKLNTMISKLARLNKPSAAVVFDFKSIEESNDGNTWFGIALSQGRDTTKEELEMAKYWYDKIKSSNVVVAEDETDASEPVADPFI